MSTRLVALGGGPDILVDRALVLVGRHPQCDVRLESCGVSRIHCCHCRDRDEVVVRDLASTNGTHINGQRMFTGQQAMNLVASSQPGTHIKIRVVRQNGAFQTEAVLEERPAQDGG